MIELRGKLLPPSDRVQVCAQSALDFSWMDRVDDSRVFVTAEGLLMYLQPEEAMSLIAACAQRFPGGQMMFDLPPSWFAWWARHGMRTSLRYKVPPMPFSLSVGELAELTDSVPGVRAVHDLPLPEGRGKCSTPCCGPSSASRCSTRCGRCGRCWNSADRRGSSVERRLDVAQGVGLLDAERPGGGDEVLRGGRHRRVGGIHARDEGAEPPRVSSTPAVSSSRYARATVLTASPICPASSRTVGSRVPGESLPSRTASMIWVRS